MQTGTEDMGPEDLTGIGTVRWSEAWRRYDASVQGVPSRPTAEQRAAMAQARRKALEEGVTRITGVVTW